MQIALYPPPLPFYFECPHSQKTNCAAWQREINMVYHEFNQQK